MSVEKQPRETSGNPGNKKMPNDLVTCGSNSTAGQIRTGGLGKGLELARLEMCRASALTYWRIRKPMKSLHIEGWFISEYGTH